MNDDEQQNEQQQQQQQQQPQQKGFFGRAADAAKKVAKDAATKAIKNSQAFAKFMAFILAHLPLIITIGIIILAILFIFGIYGFITSMPGNVMGKLKEVGVSFWGDVKGFITGDYDYVDSDDVTQLAQYLENMGYSVQGYGFGDVKYTDNSDPTYQGKTKTIEKVTGVKYRNNYLHSYLAANEETYELAKYSIWGDLRATGATLASATRSLISGVDQIDVSNYKDYSSGLLKIDGYSGTYIKFATEDLVKVNREAQTLEISQYAFKFLPYLPSFKFGMTFNYDLSDWTAKYGRPTEMFLALHIATGMPDLTYQIATNDDFNTKVNIEAQDVTIYFDDTTTFEIYSPGGNKITRERIDKHYFEYILDTVKEKRNSYDKDNVLEKDAYDDWNEIYNNLKRFNKDKKHIFLKSFFEHAGSAGGSLIIPYNEIFGTSITRDIRIPNITNAEKQYMNGVTNEQLMHLASLVYLGKDGIPNAKLPYISSVDKHWFYETIEFTVGKNGVYEAAEYARKSMKYETDDGPIKDFDITIHKALLHDETGKGILFQKREPYTHGPNKSISELFHDNTFYRYDGTIETAEKIAKTILIKDKGKGAGENYIFNGEVHQLSGEDVAKANNDQLALKQIPSFGSAQDTLSAFNILKQVDSFEAETSYRCLKELATSKEAIQEPMKKSALSEDLKQVLLWAFKDDGSKKWTVEKTQNDYGIMVTNVSGQTMIAPGDCDARMEDGKLVLKFKKLKSNSSKRNPGTVQILRKHFQQKDFYKVNDDEVYQMEMVIEGISGAKTGYVQRGKDLGTANSQVKITMRHIDKSLVGNTNNTTDDDVEDYMNQNYTDYDEEQVRKAIENEKDIADGGDSSRGRDSDDDNDDNYDPNSEDHVIDIPDSDKLALIGGNPDGTFEYNGHTYNTLQLIYAIVAAECNNSVDGAWAVITSAYNRMGKQKWAHNGPTLIEQLTASGQYAVSAALAKWYGKTIPQQVIEGVNKLIDGRQKNHGFDSFKTYGTVKGTDWIKWVEDNIISKNNCNRSQLPRYCREIGGNYYHNGDFSAEE